MTSSAGDTRSSGGGDLARTLDLLWNTDRRPSRGPKPGLTLERIVDAAVEVADRDGLDALSMRRIATELGTGTMTLYRYVPGKAELLDLMLDRVQRPEDDAAPGPGRAPSAAPDALPDAPASPGDGGWQAALEEHARATLARYHRHPWLLGVNQSRPVLGPHALDGLERVLARIRPMGLSDPELLSVIIMIDGYVVGAARTDLFWQETERTSGLTESQFWEAQRPTLEKAMSTGRYPVMAALSEDTFGPDFDHFGFGLRRILDGLEVHVARRAETA
ncbi:TetR/AcrR family transcriptional regulator [Streptomyces sp. NPDC012461]|uniref:TetR/AcrR family transcriptional regulator n=2 Tax=unclassified Streptomyces TaxID=2593676 RepID=A0A6G3QZR0_9ACTN|nr:MULTISPECIES: TetR/AcrR family transcriptional regulator [unclassified Streptomyces]MBM7091634.1 TetR/AcrR family transcriptional regulator C-terminal domain-containing protein [Streptomyces sp. S12]NEA88978.1 TetR/AcrR family transcriptional regulator [Streptomyces sp. SID14436]NEC77695.1 TetR/AcrR family transcriptional regulator [Streptomyces sp. SID7958]